MKDSLSDLVEVITIGMVDKLTEDRATATQTLSFKMIATGSEQAVALQNQVQEELIRRGQADEGGEFGSTRNSLTKGNDVRCF